jgi:hypothetical protein
MAAFDHPQSERSTNAIDEFLRNMDNRLVGLHVRTAGNSRLATEHSAPAGHCAE